MDNSDDSTRKRRPPYGAVSWYENFFGLLERVQIDKVDASFLKTNNVVSTSNVYSLINGLRFLGLIDDEGNATSRMNSLKVVGGEYEKNFQKMVEEAYALLISKVELEKALADDVINRFIREYDMTRSTATQGARIFVFLAQKAGLTLSEQLEVMKAPDRPPPTIRKKKKPKREPSPPKKEYVPKVPKDMHESKWGDEILIYLRKGDKKTRQKTARIAKRLIDMYVEEAEEIVETE